MNVIHGAHKIGYLEHSGRGTLTQSRAPICFVASCLNLQNWKSPCHSCRLQELEALTSSSRVSWACLCAPCRAPHVRTVAIVVSLRCHIVGRRKVSSYPNCWAASISRRGRKEALLEIRMAVHNASGVRKVGAVFFDLDDTLVLTHEADGVAHSATLAMLDTRYPHVDKLAVRDEFWDTLQKEPWDPEHKVDVTEWRASLWGRALTSQGVDDVDLARNMQNCFDEVRMQSFRWTANVEPIVKNLHSQGIKVGVITNGHSKVQRAKLRACNAEKIFDTILVGGEEPHPKPHPDIFFKACRLAACKPDEAVMVGDTLSTDIKGASAAGFLSTVWVNVHKQELSPTSIKPDHEIASFSELQQVLQQLGVVFN